MLPARRWEGGESAADILPTSGRVLKFASRSSSRPATDLCAPLAQWYFDWRKTVFEALGQREVCLNVSIDQGVEDETSLGERSCYGCDNCAG